MKIEFCCEKIRDSLAWDDKLTFGDNGELRSFGEDEDGDLITIEQADCPHCGATIEISVKEGGE